MVSPRALVVLLAALLLLPAPALARPPLPSAVPDLPEAPEPPEVVSEAQRRAKDAYAQATGERLDREEVDVAMEMEFRDVRLDLPGMVFGGGSLVADARLTTRLEFRVLSVGRIQEALEEAAGRPLNLSEHGVDSRGQYLTADAFRATLAGEALAAFQEEQEERVVRLVADGFPEVTVLGSYFAWTNVSASVNSRGDEPPSASRPAPRLDGRDPPVTLVSVLELQYRKRHSLVGLVDEIFAPSPGEPDGDAALRERLESEARAADHERSLFGVFGLPQVVRVNAPPGWDVTLRVTLPEGLTFEEASPDVAVDATLREARTSAYARDSEAEVQTAAVLTLGSRAHVAFLLLGAVLLAGAVVRVPALLVANRLMGRR